MRSGDRPGLQNRRVAGHPVTGGFDPHSLPPLLVWLAPGMLDIAELYDEFIREDADVRLT
jgi:hypothetical protein